MLLTKPPKRKSNPGVYLTVILFVLIVIAFVFLLNAVAGKTEMEQARVLEDAVRRAVVTCFAIEGRYPPSLSYLAEHYGLQSALDNDQFIVSYFVFASNIYPDIAVLRVGAD